MSQQQIFSRSSVLGFLQTLHNKGTVYGWFIDGNAQNILSSKWDGKTPHEAVINSQDNN